MQNKLFCHRIKLAKIVGRLKRLGEDQRGTIAVMMAFLFPILIAGFGLGFEVTNWYLRGRSMQNATAGGAWWRARRNPAPNKKPGQLSRALPSNTLYATLHNERKQLTLLTYATNLRDATYFAFAIKVSNGL